MKMSPAIMKATGWQPPEVFVAKGRDLANEVDVAQAAALSLPIERGLAGPAFLAETIVRRWADHLPLHRMERIFGRDGFELARSTICEWHLRLAKLVQLLLDAMWADALSAPVLGIDDASDMAWHL